MWENFIKIFVYGEEVFKFSFLIQGYCTLQRAHLQCDILPSQGRASTIAVSCEPAAYDSHKSNFWQSDSQSDDFQSRGCNGGKGV